MAIRKIQTYNAPCLYQVCRPVEKFDKKLSFLIDDLFDTLYDSQGVGLAGPQIGVLRRIAVIDCGDFPIELVNPVVLSSSGTQGCFEGCLSFPGESGYVERANVVTVQACDRHGEIHEYTGEGLLARAMLHEIDHLDGLVYKRLITEPPEGYTEDDGEVEDA